eukprot:5493453-Prymnesium_polylepis.1
MDKNAKKGNDKFYSSCLAVRSVSIPAFLADTPSSWALPITSINEDKLLRQLGLPKDDRKLLEGLQRSSKSMDDRLGLTEEQLSS